MKEDLTGKETLLHMPPHKKIDKFLKGQLEKRYLDRGYASSIPVRTAIRPA
jgi:hypothetical protein